MLKSKQLTYEDVCIKLFDKGLYFIDVRSKIRHLDSTVLDTISATTKHQLECILAKNQLANCAVYLNNGWKPDLEKDHGCCIILDYYDNLRIDHCAVLCSHSLSKVMFKSEELAQQAIEILGEETVKLALEPLY